MNRTPVDEEQFDQKSLEAGVYYCGEKLLDIRGTDATCIPTTACKDLVSYGQCVTRDHCIKSMYVNANKSGSFCVWPGSLVGKRPCFMDTKECFELEALTSKGGFVARYSGTNEYVCLPDHILLITEKTAECILKTDCNRTHKMGTG